MKRLLFIYVAMSCALFAVAQDKQLTMEDAFLNVRSTLSPVSIKQIQWIKNTNELSYIDTANQQEVLFRKSADGKTVKPMVTLEAFNAALAKFNPVFKLRGFPMISWNSATTFTFNTPDQLLQYDLNQQTVSLLADRKVAPGAENHDVAPTKNLIAFTVANNLWLSDGRTWKAITDDKEENIVNGKSVHREEFGIRKGIFWSPASNLLAFYRMDQTMVTDYPIINWATRPAKNENIKYPMAGDKSHEVTLGVYNVATGNTVFLKTGEPKEQFLTNIAWSPDEQFIYIAVLNRAQNHMKLNQYNATTGAFIQTLFEEKQDKYVEPQHPMLFLPNKPDQFIWQSQRDGYNHLYLYNTKGQLIKQLTQGNWLVTAINGFNAKADHIFVTTTINGGINSDLCSVNLKSGKTTRITTGNGTNTSFVNDAGTLVLNHFTSTDVPRQWTVINTNGKQLVELSTARDPLEDFAKVDMSLFIIKAVDGTDLYCRLYKPVQIDPTKKYPVIVYQYGGPHAQMITNSYNGGSRDLWFRYMAQRGYVVFTLDTRGSSNRGLAFEQATFRNLGEKEMEDQIAGVNYLKSLPYVDGNRLGLFGWSYGGFMTTNIMVKHPDLFKVGVAGGPVMDWQYYEIMYTERYMDTPDENPEGYNKTRLTDFAKNLKGKLLLIHGAQDNVVVWQHSINFLKAAVDNGKQVDYMVYPGHEHNVLGKDRVHLYNTVTRYFEENL